MGLTDAEEQLEVACSVFLVSKESVRHLVGGIVDGGEKDKRRPAPLEPIVVATVNLKQHPTERKPFPTAAMTRGATLTRASLTDGAAQPSYGGARDGDVVLLVELLGEVGIVVVVVWPQS